MRLLCEYSEGVQILRKKSERNRGLLEDPSDRYEFIRVHLVRKLHCFVQMGLKIVRYIFIIRW